MKSRARIDIVVLILCTIALHIGIISNPGFFSHDEWGRLDFIRNYGLLDYLQRVAIPQPGPEFGYPVRPVGFIQQGLTSLWMQSAPFIPHLVDVLIHACAAVIVSWALVAVGVERWVALLAGALFSVSPLTTAATGWTGASFDQWYVLFACLACWATYSSFTFGLTWLRGAALLLASAGAILSKETAVALPVVVIMTMTIAYWQSRIDRRSILARAVPILILVILPIAAYLAVRFPALMVTLTGRGTASAYTPSVAGIGRNAIGFFVFPFLPTTGEMSVSGSLTKLAASSFVHLLLIGGIWIYYGFRYAAMYVAAYFIFLMPVLTLPNVSDHYLYGSAVPQSIALAFLFRAAWLRKQKMALMLVSGMVAVMSVYMVMIQYRLYADGVCQSTFYTSLDTRIAAAPGVEKIVISSDPFARQWVGLRAVYQRRPYDGEQGRPLVLFDIDPRAAALIGEEPLRLTMEPNCLLR
jgi:hypothetical protein